MKKIKNSKIKFLSMIKALVLADSKNEFGDRVTTMVVTMPRLILSEFNTHRMFSRNSASSRAIPFKKMVQSVKENPFIPLAFQKDHSGMQGKEYFKGWRAKVITLAWKAGATAAIFAATKLHKLGLTKQLCNRLLEPFMWHTVIVTATDWENFFNLRCPSYIGFVFEDKVENDGIKREIKQKFFRSKKDLIKNTPFKDTGGIDWFENNKGQAEIHMMALAEAMWDAMNESTPKLLNEGQWHIPFGDKMDEDELQTLIHQDMPAPCEENNFEDDWGNYDTTELKIKIAVARCARISYTVMGEEGKAGNYENDIKLHDRLIKDGHLSPLEHCAKAMTKDQYGLFHLAQSQYSGNFKGFIQYRKLLEI